MDNKREEILSNLIRGFKTDSAATLIEYINTQNCVFNLDTINVLINEVLSLYQGESPNIELFYEYQLMINSIINNKNFQTIYNSLAKVTSLLEMVRILALIFKQDIEKYLSGCLDVIVGIVEVNNI